MSKKTGRTTPSRPAAKPAAVAPLIRPDNATPQDPLLRKLFWGLAATLLVVTALLSLGSGINGDDEYQNDYAARLVRHYSSFGADTAALAIDSTARDPYNKGKMYYYGGFFDMVTGFANAAMGFELDNAAYHHLRHVFNALFGVLAMVFTALFARGIAGWRAAILTLLFMFLSPRFLGDSLMNPKDIPFAAGYMMALYFMMRFFKGMPSPNWKYALGIAAGIGIAVGTRAGGLILVAYLALFAAVDFIIKNGWGGLFRNTARVGTYAVWSMGTALAGFILALTVWPYALESPVSHPLAALGEFSKLGVKIRVLFEGENLMSDQTPADYALQWIWRTIPLFTLLGFAGSLVLARRLLGRYQPLPVLMVLFTAVFPVLYVIYKDSILHDGWRHLTFVYPPMVIAAALFFISLEEYARPKKAGLYALYAVLALMAAEPAVFIARNSHFPYVYFNPLSGGMRGAFGNYETDYWGLSVKQAVDWLEDSGKISPSMQDTVEIATSFSYVLARLVNEKYNGKIKVKYVRFNSRYEKDWDYGIFPSRYIRGPHLRSGHWPNKRSLHAITANGVPLTAIEQGGGAVFRGEKAFSAQNWQEAAAAFQEELRQYDDNEIAWMKLAIAQANLNNFQATKEAAARLLEVAPGNTSGLLYRGIASMNLGDIQAAESDFQRAVSMEADFSTAYYYLAVIYKQKGDFSSALSNLQKVLDLSPGFRAAYELAAQIYEAQGDAGRAAQLREAASRF